MEKKTFVPERKAYLAPAAKSHLIAIEENIMSGDFEMQQLRKGNDNWWEDEE